MAADRANGNSADGGHGRGAPRTSSPRRILLAEDDAEMRSMLSWALRAEGYEVTECADGLTALSYVSATKNDSPAYDLFVSDVRMPGIAAFEVLARLRDKPEHPPVILITAFGDAAVHRTARQLGAAAVLNKPFELETLIAKVREVISANRNQSSA